MIIFSLLFLPCTSSVALAGGQDFISVRQYMAASGHKAPATEMAELGKMLFFDRRLSGDGTMSCATCHNPEAGFGDGLPISLSYPTTRNWRNSPTLLNVAFKDMLFHDGRAATLEEQALFPMMSAFEMNQNLDYMEEELRIVPEYARAFEHAFGSPGIDRQRVARAIAAFERTLMSVNSPLDRFMEGDRAAMDEAALTGMEIFRGKGGCIRCHHGVNLSDGGFHRTGVPGDPALARDPRTLATLRFVARLAGYDRYALLEEDPGRYLASGRREDWKAFATPTLRDLRRTAPYMHNGVFESLAQVIEFYDAGGGEGGTSGLRPLGLTKEEKSSLEAFLLEALEGESIKISYPRIP